MAKYNISGDPNVKKDVYINPNRTFEESNPSFLAHHLQTPNDLNSKNSNIF
jgi:hypothetical protein